MKKYFCLEKYFHCSFAKTANILIDLGYFEDLFQMCIEMYYSNTNKLFLNSFIKFYMGRGNVFEVQKVLKSCFI